MSLLERPVGGFLDDLASAAPTPGGGSAAALAAAAGAALVALVARLSERQAGEAAARVRDRADGLRRTLAGLIATDARAFDAVMAAYRRPRGTEDEKSRRREAVQTALSHAAEVPLQVSALAVAVLQAAADLAESANPNAVSDLGVAAALAAAGVEGARLNVFINVKSIGDAPAAARLRGEADRLSGAARTIREQVLLAVERRLGT
ncbi:MAG: cyclodeaminase/cyclohydrolase family protein [Armatimonadetes bacterium]|nr:cyclodeaminase/cyclohydrolase family protein [Armatimonadota bacterium]